MYTEKYFIMWVFIRTLEKIVILWYMLELSTSCRIDNVGQPHTTFPSTLYHIRSVFVK